MMTMTVRVFAALALFAAAPAQATSVGDVMRAHATLHALEGRTEADYLAYRAEHTPELLQATAVLNLARMAFESVMETANAAFVQYGVRLVCNYDEESRIGDDELVTEFVADGRARFGLPEAETRRRLYQADYQEMLARTLLAHYRCPSAIIAAPGNPLPEPPAR